MQPNPRRQSLEGRRYPGDFSDETTLTCHGVRGHVNMAIGKEDREGAFDIALLVHQLRFVLEIARLRISDLVAVVVRNHNLQKNGLLRTVLKDEVSQHVFKFPMKREFQESNFRISKNRFLTASFVCLFFGGI